MVLHPVRRDATDGAARSPEARLEEAVGLAAAIDLDVVERRCVRVTRPQPSTLFGGGAVEEWAGTIAMLEPEVVVVDTDLTPIQQRNLERAWKAKVIDRTGLILEIFGERARTREGQLQVDLRPSQLPALPPRPVVDPPGAAARWRRLHGRPGRTADRTRPAADRRPHRPAEEAAGGGAGGPAACIAARASGCRIPWWHWSATPTPESRRCSTG